MLVRSKRITLSLRRSVLILKRCAALMLAGAVAAGTALPLTAGPVTLSPSATSTEIADVLEGDAWLRHFKDDLMPYWDMPEAFGVPVGNFPSFRGRSGELLPESTNRGLSTLARGVYGYSLAFMLTGEERYLTHAKAGLDWINTKAKDPVHGGYFGELDVNGNPVDPTGNKDVFDLASLGLAYGMYFNVTRDPAAEADLLAVRDLIFDKYYDPATNRVKDSLTYDLTTEVDTGGNGGDITNYLVPGTTLLLPNLAILADASRRAQFRTDLRRLTDGLITHHKNTAAVNPANRFWFWGRTLRFGTFNAAQTDLGHNIKSYAMIHNANQVFADRPWSGLAADRTTLLGRAWDDVASRWNQRIRNFQLGNVEPDSAWWIHDEADQLLAALDLSEGTVHQAQLARSAQSFLDVYVDDDPAYPARETFARIERTGTMTDLRKSFFGKNMLHNNEHALIMYLHGRTLEGEPAKLHYAFPDNQALTAVAKPYWFDAAGEVRTVTRPLESLPGHHVVEVEFTGIGAVPPEPFPAPNDSTPPTSTATVTPAPNEAGWHRGDVSLSFSANDDLVGVKEIHVLLDESTGRANDTAVIDPGDQLELTLSHEGDYEIRYFAVDALGNEEHARTLRVRIDRTAPSVSGMPRVPCVIWPPNERMVPVSNVTGGDALSGVAELSVGVEADEPSEGDITVVGGVVAIRAIRDDEGDGRVYTVVANVIDRAGNVTTREGTCTVPHDLRR